MISLLAKLRMYILGTVRMYILGTVRMYILGTVRMYILGTVRMSLLHMIMMRRMALLIVPNVKGTAYMGLGTVLKAQNYFCTSTRLQFECNFRLYFCSLHNTVYYPISTAPSL
jgi:hypothetical protein